jgi:hypothetical protein
VIDHADYGADTVTLEGWYRSRGIRPPRRPQRVPQGQRTACPAGHPYDETNTWVSVKGWRYCRTCNRERQAQRRLYMQKRLRGVAHASE